MQVLFDLAEYEQLELYARRQRCSVGAAVRHSVRRTVASDVSAREAALARMLARADSHPQVPVGDWDEVKQSFERDSLRDIP